VKFLIDQNLSPRLASLLTAAGHDAVHTDALGLATAPDEVVLERARVDDRVVVSADSDFGTVLAATRATARPFSTSGVSIDEEWRTCSGGSKRACHSSKRHSFRDRSSC
jgi:hypothetical protein